MKRSLFQPKEDNGDDRAATLSTSPQAARSQKKQKYSQGAPHTTTTNVVAMEVDSSKSKNMKVPNDALALEVVADEEDWTKVEKRKAKKAKKVEARSEDSPPRLLYAPTEISRKRAGVEISDIRDLVLHLLGELGPVGWVKVENRNAIRKVVTIFTPGVLPEHIGALTHPGASPYHPISIPLPPTTAPSLLLSTINTPLFGTAEKRVVKTLFGGTKEIDIAPASASPESKGPKLPFLARTFSHACPTRAPGDAGGAKMHSVLGAFFQLPITAEERKRRTMEGQKDTRSPGDVLRYVLTSAQMVENEYPLPTYMSESLGQPSVLGPDWKETPKATDEDTADNPPVYSVDCEMCLTEDGMELTRACVIDYWTGKVEFDHLVKPPKPILDYLTQWSGITEESLRDVTTPLADVQTALLALLAPAPQDSETQRRTPILLGHSLDSDLRALKIAHPRCIDTALLYHHPRGRPLKPGLAWLTNKYCDRQIQNRGAGGHDADEDARACIELLQRKIKGGPGFGEYKSVSEMENIFERLKRSKREGLRTAIFDRGNPAAWHGTGADEAVGVKTDDEAVKGVLGCLEQSDYMWVRLSGVAEASGWITQKGSGDLPHSVPPPEPSSFSVDAALSTLNSHLSLIHAALPPRTALVIFTGHADPRRMAALQARKNAFETALKAANALAGAGGKEDSRQQPVGAAPDVGDARWTTQDARNLEEAVEHAKKGLLFLCLK